MDHPRPRRDRAVRLHDEHRQRIPHHEPDAQDVQEAMTYAVAQVAAILATALFIFSLYWMNDPKTARHAVAAGVTGMLVAVLATWFQPEIVHHGWIVLAIILGFLTFTGSLMATGKLQEVKWIPQRPVTYFGQNVVNVGVLVIAVALGVLVVLHPAAPWAPRAFLAVAGLALLFGVLLIIPIGGADMPTVISILNSYAGLSAVAMGFVL